MEIVFFQVDLAADDDGLAAGDAQRNLADCLGVIGDIVAPFPVAAGQRAAEQSILIIQYDGQTVDFILDDQFAVRKLGPGFVDPGRHLAGAVRLVQAEYGNKMFFLRERLIEVGANPLAWRIRLPVLRVAAFQGQQFIEQGVVLGVADKRLGLDVILVLMTAQFLAQFLDTLLRVHDLHYTGGDGGLQ